MSLAHGNNTKLAFAEQVDFGTPVARTKGLRILEDGLVLSNPLNQKTVMGHRSSHILIPGKRGGGGPIKFYFPPNGGELFLKHGFGAVAATVTTALDEAAGNYYTRAYSLAAALPAAGLSIEMDRDAAAIGTAYLYDSCKVNKLTLEQKMEEGLIIGLEMMGREEAEVAVTAGLTYQSLKTFDWDKCVITLAGQEFESEEFSFDLDNALDGDNYKFGSRLRKNITAKDTRKGTGKLKGEFTSATAYNYFRNQTEVALVATWTGRLLGQDDDVDVYEKLVLTLPRITFTGETPPAKGAGRIELNLPFQCSATLDTDNSEATLQLINTTA